MRWLLGTLALVACSGRQVPRPGPPPVAAARTAAIAAAAPERAPVPFGELPPADDPRVEQRFAEARARNTPENMMWGQKQIPPEHWHGLRTPLKRPYPGVPYSEVHAFTFGNDRAPARNRGEALLDRKVPGCGGNAVAKDGTLCPSLNPPGKLLTTDQIARLVDVLEKGQPHRGDVPSVSMCVPERNLLFVFYDGTRPVAEMWMDAGCGYLGVHSAAAKLYPKEHMPRAREALAELCRELALPGSGCKPPEPELDAAISAQAERDSYAVSRIRARRVAIGVPLELTTSQLSQAQKERLCFDQAIEAPFGWGGGFECQNGYRAFHIDPDTCLARFPSCEVTVGELMACERHAHLDPCLGAAEAAHCIPLLPCFFSISSSAGPAPKY